MVQSDTVFTWTKVDCTADKNFFEQAFSVFHHKKFSHLLENNFQAVEGWRER